MKKSPIIGFYTHWVLLTYMGVIFAVCGILSTVKGNFKLTIIFLMFSGICDLFDGAVARKAKRSDMGKNFGIQIDSLADLISFGVLPSVLGYMLFLKSEDYNLVKDIFVSIVASLYVLCALIRLAYFNILKDESEKNNKKLNSYQGLPVTSIALIIPLVYSICVYLDVKFYKVYIPMLFLVSIAFIINIKIPKLKLKSMLKICFLTLLFMIYLLVSKGAI